MHDGISPAVRQECYKRDGHICTNPKCIFRDEVEKLKNGEERWKNKIWDADLEMWIQKKLHLHHCLWRSRYRGADRDQPWNLTTLCDGCHNLLHNPPVICVSWSKDLEQWCIDLAISRRESEGLPPLDYSRNDARFSKPKYMRRADREKHDRAKSNQYKKNYERKKKFFMERNQGMSPIQVQYQRKKGLKFGEN